MKISAINFRNFNLKPNKTNTFQTCPTGLKADTVEFSKNISFKGELKSEEEILELSKKVETRAQELTNKSCEILANATLELREARYIKNKAMTCGEVNNDGTITFRKSFDDNSFDEWVFESNGNLKSVSKDVSTQFGIKKIESRYTFINNGELEFFEESIEEDGRSTKTSETWEFCCERLADFYASKVTSQKGIVHSKEHFDYFLGEFIGYSKDLVEGVNWFALAEKLSYRNDGEMIYYKDYSSTSKGKEYEQISYFKNGKLISTKTQE